MRKASGGEIREGQTGWPLRQRTAEEVLYVGEGPGEEARTLFDPWWGRGEALDMMRPGERPGIVCLAAFGGPLLCACQIGLGGGALAGDDLYCVHRSSFLCRSWWWGLVECGPAPGKKSSEGGIQVVGRKPVNRRPNSAFKPQLATTSHNLTIHPRNISNSTGLSYAVM
jgi:hypothetical protein